MGSSEYKIVEFLNPDRNLTNTKVFDSVKYKSVVENFENFVWFNINYILQVFGTGFGVDQAKSSGRFYRRMQFFPLQYFIFKVNNIS